MSDDYSSYMGSDDLERDRAEVREIANRISERERQEERSGARLIMAERSRQITTEGWTPEHDAEHAPGELTAAALCYLSAALCIINPSDPRAAPATHEPPVAPYWPWEPSAYKVSLSDPLRSLVKAGALIAAEIDRLQALDG